MRASSSDKRPKKQYFLMDTRPILEIIQHNLSSHAVDDEKLPQLTAHLKELLLKN